MNGPTRHHTCEGLPWHPAHLQLHHHAASSRIVLWKFSIFFVTAERVTLKVMAFQHCIYTCFVCSCVGRKGTYKSMWNRESNQKSGLRWRCAANKKCYKARSCWSTCRQRDISVSLFWATERSSSLNVSLYFQSACRVHGFIQPSSSTKHAAKSKLPAAIKST